jgi:hypothetical protein
MLGPQPASPEFIGANGMFRLKSGYVSKYYEGSKDRLHLDVHGEVELGSLEIEMQVAAGDMAKFNSDDYVLPITNNISIRAFEGSKTTLGKNLALLPGAEVTIDQGAELVIDDIRSGMAAGKLVVTDKASGKSFNVVCNLTERQQSILLAGGLLNYTKEGGQ